MQLLLKRIIEQASLFFLPVEKQQPSFESTLAETSYSVK